MANWVSTGMLDNTEDCGGFEVGWIWDCFMKETSVKRKGSSLRDGHGVERRVSAEDSLSFWRGKGDEEEEEEGGRESSRVSAS